MLFAAALLSAVNNLHAAEPPPLAKVKDSKLQIASGLVAPQISVERNLYRSSYGLSGTDVTMLPPDRVEVYSVPPATSRLHGKVAGLTPQSDIAVFSLDPGLQIFTDSLLRRTSSPHVAIVAMEPSTGRILALSERSKTHNKFASYGGLPAASLFKIVTSAAAVEMGVPPQQDIKFRGGDYTLNQWNYRPDARRDRRTMDMTEALGKSVNPVFGRVALKFLNGPLLGYYAKRFGFNMALSSDIPLPNASASIPPSELELSRTAAGFGAVYFSPIHAAAMMSGLANGGRMPRPVIVDSVVTKDGRVKYSSRPQQVVQMVRPSTALTVMRMMEATVTKGTSRKEFYFRQKPRLPGVRVAGKTGTLRGKSPEGINHWFVAAAPIESPRIAIAIVSVDRGRSPVSPSRMGRMIFEYYFKGSNPRL